MNQHEFSKFAMALKTYYPKDVLLPNEQAMSLWYEQLKDIPYDRICIFLNNWVSTEKWSPAISDIKAGVAEIDNGIIDDWGKGWQEVIKSIQNYGYYRESDALNSMSDITREVVKRLGFQNICLSENISADRANFRNLYIELTEKKRHERVLTGIETRGTHEKVSSIPLKAFDYLG